MARERSHGCGTPTTGRGEPTVPRGGAQTRAHRLRRAHPRARARASTALHACACSAAFPGATDTGRPSRNGRALGCHIRCCGGLPDPPSHTSDTRCGVPNIVFAWCCRSAVHGHLDASDPAHSATCRSSGSASSEHSPALVVEMFKITLSLVFCSPFRVPSDDSPEGK